MKQCSVDGCVKKHYGHGFCNKHYKAQKAYGDPLIVAKGLRRPLKDRFFEKVEIGVGCWRWIGSKNPNGYGQINPGGRSSPVSAHRVSWEIHRGPIPNGSHVLHKCDNPECVNPDHLFLGDHMDNMQDMWRKGRGRCDGAGRKGDENGNSKLTWIKVKDIRDRIAGGETHASISKIYGVTRPLIGMIANQKIWKTEGKRP